MKRRSCAARALARHRPTAPEGPLQCQTAYCLFENKQRLSVSILLCTYERIKLRRKQHNMKKRREDNKQQTTNNHTYFLSLSAFLFALDFRLQLPATRLRSFVDSCSHGSLCWLVMSLLLQRHHPSPRRGQFADQQPKSVLLRCLYLQRHVYHFHQKHSLLCQHL